MFEKIVYEDGTITYEHNQCSAILKKDDDTIYLPFLMGFNKGVLPVKSGGVHAKELLSWLVNETGINKFIITEVLTPDEYAQKLHGTIVPTIVPEYKVPDLRVHFTWDPKRYQNEP